MYLDVWGWTTQGDCDLLQAGVKGDPPGVADWTVVVSGQQVDFRGLHCLLHPFKYLPKEKIRNTKHTCKEMLIVRMAGWVEE